MRDQTTTRTRTTDTPQSELSDESQNANQTSSPSQQTNQCPECSGRVQSEGSESVCGDCGLVISEGEIDHGKEWRAYTTQEKKDKSRVGPPSTVMQHDKGLSTDISWQNQDGYGNYLNEKQRIKMSRLRKWQKRTRTDISGRQIKKGLAEVDRIGSALGAAQSVREMAAVIFRRAKQDDLLRGRSIEAVTAGAVYHGFRAEGTSRSLDEITDVARCGRKEIGRTYRYIAGELGLETTIQYPSEFVPRFVDKLGASHLVQRQTMEILQEVKDTQVISGTDPTGIAASAMYIAGRMVNEKYTQAGISEVSGVTEVTIRHRYKDILEEIDCDKVEVDPEEVGTGPKQTDYQPRNPPNEDVANGSDTE